MCMPTLMVTNISAIGPKTCCTREVKPDTRRLAHYPEIMKSWILKEKSFRLLHYIRIIPNFILNVCPYAHIEEQSWCFIKSTSLCNRRRSLQKTTTKQNSELQILVPVDTSTKRFSHQTVKEYYRIGGEQNQCKSQRNKEFSERLCLSVPSEAVPIKSH